MKRRERHYTGLGILNALISPWKGKKKRKRKEKRKHHNTGYWYLVTHLTPPNRASLC